MSNKDIAIKAEGVSKVYRIGTAEQGHDNVASAIVDFIKSPLKNYRKYRSLYDFRDLESRDGSNPGGDSNDTIWALRDLCFEIKRGEIVGFIGTNGAGKSTLLKILSRITPPTMGRVEIRGRVSSLLEVGTGFHPELTGRENVYLNGTILGMRKKEVDQKFDEIVEFSGVERFLDTPVKRYSSGMRVRLAFAVAAHLEPEILIIDEVLAVGDAAFQRKCINKMQAVGEEGRTVLFVSHNMPAVTRLCSRAVLLDGGRLINDGPARLVVSEYLRVGRGVSSARKWPDVAGAPSGDVARLLAITVRTRDGKIADTVDISQPVVVEIEYEVLKAGYMLIPHFHLHNEAGTHVFSAADQDGDLDGRPWPVGRYVSKAEIPGNLFAECTIFVSPGLVTVEPNIPQFYVRDAVAFQVVEGGDGDSRKNDYKEQFDGVVRPLLSWERKFHPLRQEVVV